MGDPSDARVDQFVVYAGYGEVMHRLQALELSLWLIQCRNIKAKSTSEQVMAKVEKWNETTFGNLMRGMRNQTHWPPSLVDKLTRAVQIRNYLAHHYLREYFAARPSEQNLERAAQELAEISVFLENLVSEVDTHAAALGVALGPDKETMAGIEQLRPTEWLSPLNNPRI